MANGHARPVKMENGGDGRVGRGGGGGGGGGGHLEVAFCARISTYVIQATLLYYTWQMNDHNLIRLAQRNFTVLVD